MGDPSPLMLTLPSRMEYLPLVRRFVEGVCELGQLDEATRDAIVLAANEATSNVIRHAHQCCPSTPVRIQCRLIEDGIEVWLFDLGAPFDPQTVPHLDPAEIRPGGRGVFLMRSLVDEIICQPLEEGGNALRLVKRRPAG